MLSRSAGTTLPPAMLSEKARYPRGRGMRDMVKPSGREELTTYRSVALWQQYRPVGRVATGCADPDSDGGEQCPCGAGGGVRRRGVAVEVGRDNGRVVEQHQLIGGNVWGRRPRLDA